MIERSIDPYVLLTLIPSDRWTTYQEIAVQVGSTPQIVRREIGRLMQDGKDITMTESGCTRLA